MILKTDNGYEFQIDDEDLPKISGYHWYGRQNWSRKRNGSIQINKTYIVANKQTNDRRVTVVLHRLIISAPKGMEVDHINGDTFDNRKSNLRSCTRGDNCRNSKVPINNTSGFKGVCIETGYEKWRSYIKVNSHQIRLGTFDTAREAAIAYNQAAITFFGEFARLNVLKDAERK